MCDERTDVIKLMNWDDGDVGQTSSLEVVRRCFLKIVKGKGRGKELKLGSGSVVAGRSSFADLFLDTASASRKHFEVVSETGGYVLRDLNSTNGTAVNRTRVAECRLSDGDIISVGNIDMVYFEKTRLERKSG